MAKPDPKDRGKAKIEDGCGGAESGPLESSSYSSDGFTAELLPGEDPIPLAREQITEDEQTDISLWSAINPADWNWAVFSPIPSLGYGGQGSSQEQAPFRQALFVPSFATYPGYTGPSSSQMWMRPEAGQWGWQGHGMQHLPHTKARSVPYQGYRGPPPPPSSSSQTRMSLKARQWSWVMAAPYYPQQPTHPYSYATMYLGYVGSSPSSQMVHGSQQQPSLPARGVQAGSAARRRRSTSVWRRRTASSNLQQRNGQQQQGASHPASPQTRPSTSSTASSEPDQEFELSDHDFPLAQEGFRILPPKRPGC